MGEEGAAGVAEPAGSRAVNVRVAPEIAGALDAYVANYRDVSKRMVVERALRRFLGLESDDEGSKIEALEARVAAVELEIRQAIHGAAV